MNYAYDELGKMIGKAHGNNVNYTYIGYNIQGWQNVLYSQHFNERLTYYETDVDNPTRSTSSGYTGNITGWEFAHRDNYNVIGTYNKYGLYYDKLSRLVDARLYEGGINTNRFTERDITYDKNGNKQPIQRSLSGTLKEDIVYTKYTGNCLNLITVNGALASYNHDVNGNTIMDGWNGFLLRYNCLNLLYQTFSDSSQNYRVKTTYSWLADGTKLGARKGELATGTEGLEYLGSLEYQRQGGNLSLESAAFGGGRINKTSSGYDVNYFITDHLGSVRVIVDAIGAVKGRNDFMPYGGRWTAATIPAAASRYQFTGKEYQSAVNVNYTDHGARMYNWRIPRWNGFDPLAEIDPSVSPFAYCRNNPVNRTDPTGLFSTGSDTTKMVNIEPVVVVAPPQDNRLANLLNYMAYAISWWGSEINKSMGNYDTDFHENINTVMEFGVSMGAGWGMAKTFKSTTNSTSKVKTTQRNIKWTFGKHKTTQKWMAQMTQRGWTTEQITETISRGKTYNAVNNVNKTNTATRYVHPISGKSIVLDDVTNELIQVGDIGFKYD